MRPIWIDCQSCEASYQVKHDLSEEHYQVEFCSFCGSKLDEFYDPNQRELNFGEEEDEDLDW